MADIALTTADKVNIIESMQQHSAPVGEDVVAGAPVYIDATTGKFLNSDANAAPANVAPYGISDRTAKSGQTITAVRRGKMDGWAFAGNYGTKVFASDTVGRIADAAGTASLPLGMIIGAFGAPLGTAADKILLVECV